MPDVVLAILCNQLDVEHGASFPQIRSSFNSRVHRLSLGIEDNRRFFIVKRLQPHAARAVECVARRWLPAVGASLDAPPLLAVAPEDEGQATWHVYEDLGDRTLKPKIITSDTLSAVLTVISRIHSRFAEHPMLSECRKYGMSYQAEYFESSVDAATRSLGSIEPYRNELSVSDRAVCERLMTRLRELSAQRKLRTEVLTDLGGPVTLLHGDLWPSNILFVEADRGCVARLVDWDRVGIGFIGYDLSVFLSRLPNNLRWHAIDRYRNSCGEHISAHLSSITPTDLNLLMETVEMARLANCVIWPAIEASTSRSAWAFHDLERIDSWFEL